MSSTARGEVTVAVYAALCCCLVGTLLGYAAFHHFVGVDTECAGMRVTCGNTDVPTQWTVTGGVIGLVVGAAVGLSRTVRHVVLGLRG